MSNKVYRCEQFPRLTIAGVCVFTNEFFETNSPVIQSKIEMSQSFISGSVIIWAVDDDAAIAAEDIKAIPWTEIQKMKKAQLVEVTQSMGIEFGEDATRTDLLSLVAAERKREE